MLRTKFVSVVFAATTMLAATPVAAQSLDLDALLKTLEQGQVAQSKENQAREAEFAKASNEQAAILQARRNARDAELAKASKLETTFEQQEVELAQLTETLSKRMGSLKELFGVLQQVSGDTQGKLQSSVISAQLPNRDAFLSELAQKMGSSSKLASIEEMERVWFELQREMTEQGKVSRFTRDVIVAGGEKQSKEVVRVGAFNLVSDGQYLSYNPTTDTLSELTRQPASRFGDSAAALQQSQGELVKFTLDPTGGSILGLLVQAPNTKEQVEQGGAVGYVILAVGVLALIVALERFVALFVMGTKIRRQLKTNVAKDDNPLGRVMKVKDTYPDVSYDTLELKLSEAILREMPRITRNLTLIKIISVVAPLLGLLGTVTGMINTFQAITLFGTGDPKLMAGGISTALVTTVLGLVVAIPTVFLYTVLNTRAKNLLVILQEQSAGIIAERSEKGA